MVILLLMIGMFILSWAAAEMAKAGERAPGVLRGSGVQWESALLWRVFTGPRPAQEMRGDGDAIMANSQGMVVKAGSSNM